MSAPQALPAQQDLRRLTAPTALFTVAYVFFVVFVMWSEMTHLYRVTDTARPTSVAFGPLFVAALAGLLLARGIYRGGLASALIALLVTTLRLGVALLFFYVDPERYIRPAFLNGVDIVFSIIMVVFLVRTAYEIWFHQKVARHVRSSA